MPIIHQQSLSESNHSQKSMILDFKTKILYYSISKELNVMQQYNLTGMMTLCFKLLKIIFLYRLT